MLRRPGPGVKFAAQRLIHRVVNRIRIDLRSLFPVKSRPPGDVSGPAQCFGLRLCAQLKLSALLDQRVAAQSVAQRRPLLHRIRKVRHIDIRDAPAQALDTDQCVLRPAVGDGHRQGVRKLRSEDVHQIRLKVLHDLFKALLQGGIIDLRRVQVFGKAVENGAVHFFSAVFQLPLRRACHAHRKSRRLTHDAREASGQPPLPVGTGQAEMLRENRKHNVAQP